MSRSGPRRARCLELAWLWLVPRQPSVMTGHTGLRRAARCRTKRTTRCSSCESLVDESDIDNVGVFTATVHKKNEDQVFGRLCATPEKSRTAVGVIPFDMKSDVEELW